jgi:hypothetical protein
MHPTALYPESSTGSPAEHALNASRPIDLPLEDSDDGLTNSPEAGTDAFFHQVPDADNEHHADGLDCPDCRRVADDFRNFLLALNEPGAALAFNEQDAEAIEESVAQIYALEEKLAFEPDRMVPVPPNISMFSPDFELFLPSLPDRSSEFLELGADPDQVKIWFEDYTEDVDKLRRDWEGRYASGARNFEVELAPHGEALKKLARDTLRNFVEVRFVAEVKDWVDEDLEKCRRGEWFLSRSPPGTSEDNKNYEGTE